MNGRRGGIKYGWVFAVAAVSAAAAFAVFYPKGLKSLKNLYYLGSLPSLEHGAGYGILFMFGLLASVHCVGMCGGLMLTQVLRKSMGSPLLNAGLYNAGRVVSYTLTGMLAGGLGEALSLPGSLRGLIPLIGGVFMMLMAVNLLEIFPLLRNFSLPIPRNLAKRLYRSAESNGRPFLVGLLTGLMPCGPLQIAQVYALSSKNASAGALSMFLFAIGTTPALFAFGAFSGMMSRKFSRGMTKVSAVVVGVMGLLMVWRGLALSGILLPMAVATEDSGNFIVAVRDGDFQRLTTEFEAYSYPAIQFKSGIPVEWTILVNEEDYNSCNNSIEVPAFGLKADLNVGETIIKFTPDKEGDFIYTCWMGMITSTIRVKPAF
jgi:sulfite exporter TauE/SafE